MARYESMDAVEGRKCLQYVWNLFFKPLAEQDFFVEPWENQALRDCAQFRLGSGEKGPDEIFFFAADEKLIEFLKETPGELYLFGAYNQIRVCQMRVRGTVTLEERHPEKEWIRKRLRDIIRSRIGAPVNKLSKEEAEERFAILEKGLLFRFRINSWAYSTYERG